MHHILAHPPQRVPEVSWVPEAFLVVCAGERQRAVPKHDAGILQGLFIEGVVMADVVDGERFHFWVLDISHLGKESVIVIFRSYFGHCSGVYSNCFWQSFFLLLL